MIEEPLNIFGGDAHQRQSISTTNLFKTLAERDQYLKVGFESESKLLWTIESDKNTVTFYEFLEEMLPNLPSCTCKVANIVNADNVKIIKMDHRRQNYALMFDDKQCYLYPLFNKTIQTQRISLLQANSNQNITAVSDMLDILSFHAAFAITNEGEVHLVQVCKNTLSLTSRALPSNSQSVFGKLRRFVSTFTGKQKDHFAKVRCVRSQKLQTGCYLELAVIFQGKISVVSLALELINGEIRVQSQKESYSEMLTEILEEKEVDILDFQMNYIDEQLAVSCLSVVQASSNEPSLVFSQLSNICNSDSHPQLIKFTLKDLIQHSPLSLHGKLYDPSNDLSSVYYIVYNSGFQQIGWVNRKNRTEITHDTKYIDDFVYGLGGISKGLHTTAIYLVERLEGLKEITSVRAPAKQEDITRLKGERLDGDKNKRISGQKDTFGLSAGYNNNNNSELFCNILTIFQQNTRMEIKSACLNQYVSNQSLSTAELLDALSLIIQEMKSEKTRNIVLAVNGNFNETNNNNSNNLNSSNTKNSNNKRYSNQKLFLESAFSIENDIVQYELNKKLQKLLHFKEFIESSELKNLNGIETVISSSKSAVLNTSIAQGLRQLQLQLTPEGSEIELFRDLAARTLILTQQSQPYTSLDRIYVNMDQIPYFLTAVNQYLKDNLHLLKGQHELLILLSLWSTSLNSIDEIILKANLQRQPNEAQGQVEETLLTESIRFLELLLLESAVDFSSPSQAVSQKIKQISAFCIRESQQSQRNNNANQNQSISNHIIEMLVKKELYEEAFTVCKDNHLKDNIYSLYFRFNLHVEFIKEYLLTNQSEIPVFFKQLIGFEKQELSQVDLNNKSLSYHSRLLNDFPEFSEYLLIVLKQEEYYHLYVLYQTLLKPVIMNDLLGNEMIQNESKNNNSNINEPQIQQLQSIYLNQAIKHNISHLQQHISNAKSAPQYSSNYLILELQQRYQQPNSDFFILAQTISASKACINLNDKTTFPQAISLFQSKRIMQQFLLFCNYYLTQNRIRGLENQ